VDYGIIQEHREVLRQIREGRRLFSLLVGHGPALNYGFALLAGPSDGFRLLTEHASLGFSLGGIPGDDSEAGLTVEMLQALADEPTYVMGTTPAMVERQDWGMSDQLVTEFQLALMVYPPAAKPPRHCSFVVDVWPEQLETEPMYLFTVNRPAGWPR